MKGWRERAAYVLQKHGAIAAKMKSAPGPGTSDYQEQKMRQYGDTRNALLVEFLYEYLWNNGIELTCLKKYTWPKRVFTGLLSFADM